jgi:hypothetical protein
VRTAAKTEDGEKQIGAENPDFMRNKDGKFDLARCVQAPTGFALMNPPMPPTH